MKKIFSNSSRNLALTKYTAPHVNLFKKSPKKGNKNDCRIRKILFEEKLNSGEKNSKGKLDSCL